MTSPRIVLASASPRRLELLRSIGWDPVVMVPDIDETVVPGEMAEHYVARLAQHKAATVAGDLDHDLDLDLDHDLDLYNGAIVIAADTAVDVDESIVGKPTSTDEAIEMISQMAGRDHLVHTGVAAIGAVEQGLVRRHLVVTTKVTFVPLTPTQVAEYVALGESMDKAGGYAIQGAGAALVERIDGSPSNVIGLPLAETVRLVEGLSDKSRS